MAHEDNDPYQRGRDAVSLLWSKWRERPQVDDPHDDEFARGALEEIIYRLDHSSDIDKEIRQFSEAAAEQVTTASRTIFEILQNADDLGATNLKLGPTSRQRRYPSCAQWSGRRGGRCHCNDLGLLIDEAPRFGGLEGRFRYWFENPEPSWLETKRALCAPYHFAVEKGMLSIVRPHAAVRGLYDPSAGHTLLTIELDREYRADDVEGWAKAIDTPLT